MKRLRELGLVQVGRGVINVTEDGLKAIGYHSNPVIVTVRVSPSKRLQAYERFKTLPAVEIFRVTGDADVVLVVEQDKLDHVLGTLSQIDGVVETKSLVSIGESHMDSIAPIYRNHFDRLVAESAVGTGQT